MILWLFYWYLLCTDIVVPDTGDVLGVDTKLVVDVLGVDNQLVVEVSDCCQCPHQHAQLYPFLNFGRREL